MRKWIVLLPIALLAVSSGALALQPVTAAQLEQMLAHSHGLSDADLAARLSDLDLTERFSSARVGRCSSALAGPRSQRALLALADRSAFLPPPAADLPAGAAPGLAEQRRIMSLAATYVTQAVPQLPHLYATRAVTHFEGEPASGGEPISAVRATRITRTIVQYRDGQEVIVPLAKTAAQAPELNQGLRTWGVFGPILSLVLLDAAQNKLGWERWERGSMDSPVAVFRFSVPREQSHYQVRYCCTLSDYGMENHEFQQSTGYHGEIAVEPSTGAVLRIVIQADLQPSDPISRADVAVEYASVLLGGTEYECPIRSISISTAQTLHYVPGPDGAVRRAMGPPQMLLNHADFDGFHLFRAEARVLSANEERGAGAAPDLTLPSHDPGQPAPSGSDQPSEEILADGSTPTPAQPASPSSVVAEAPEITTAAATALPDQPMQPAAQSQQPQPTAFRLQINARLVDVNVVALDKKGHPITGLKRDDFEIYDNGVRQDIRSFTQADTQQADQLATVSPSASGPQAFSNQQRTLAAQPQPGNTIVFLLDPSNLVYNDLIDARRQMLQFLDKAPPSAPVAFYIMRYHGFQVMEETTTDHAKVAARIAKWTPTGQDLLNARDEEDRNRQKMEYVHNLEDMLSVNGNFTLDTQVQSEALDPQLRQLGSEPGPTALDILVGVAGHLASMQGHKSLVWITSDNALVDWNLMSDTVEKHSKYIEPAVLRTQEAMNNAQVSVYPLDASRLEANVITADIQNRNVQLTPTYQMPTQLAQKVQGPEASSGSGSDADPNYPFAMDRNIISTNRLYAQMQQDMRPIEGVFREVAEATGGQSFRRSSNIEGELNGVVADGHATYLIGFTPATQADGKYHVLTVKLLNHRDAIVRYRTGYKYDKEPTSLKDRFARALWQQADTGEIAVSARPIVDSAGSAIRVTVAGADLDLIPQNSPAAAPSAPQAQPRESSSDQTAAPRSFWSGKLDIFLVQRAEDTMQAHITGHTVGLRLRPATYDHAVSDGLTFDERIQQKPGTGSLRVVVVDVNSGRIGSVTVPTTAFAQGLTAQTN